MSVMPGTVSDLAQCIRNLDRGDNDRCFHFLNASGREKIESRIHLGVNGSRKTRRNVSFRRMIGGGRNSL